ncbi:hypothetical protein [Pseudogemmobacter humi]|uniref:Outer membrane protein beta-barrel domain-containing protein n=1 Tax=Pseudogemmobacter humi TaxID=2483812 RepID=A0A3P5XLV2_9RHOB|nr:hypothetical protein [Pseudogemmobacter humi]VDC31226.1 hypothetical protein XINFAN_02797 [Pseudogemmobacter humi]
MKKAMIGMAIALALGAGPASADDIGLGIGLSWVFGNSGSSGAAIGLKAFSSREEDKAAGSLGIDYHFATSAVRPNIGIAWIGNDIFADANFGYNVAVGKIDFGLGLGAVN